MDAFDFKDDDYKEPKEVAKDQALAVLDALDPRKMDLAFSPHMIFNVGSILALASSLMLSCFFIYTFINPYNTLNPFPPPPPSAEQFIDFDTGNETINLLIGLINQYRSEKGLELYEYSEQLASVAQAHTEYQASIQSSTHFGEGGTNSLQRVQNSGYGEGASLTVDEIIYSGDRINPITAMEWWKQDPPHNFILLSPLYTEFGIGVVTNASGIYYTIVVANKE